MTVEEFKNEVLKWSEKIGVEPKEIHVRPMKKKLASCSSRGRLSFSIELLNESSNNRAYVIIHELLHLKYPNHGKMFKSLFQHYLNYLKNGNTM